MFYLYIMEDAIGFTWVNLIIIFGFYVELIYMFFVAN